MSSERKMNAGIRVTLWPAVLLSFVLAIGTGGPQLLSADASTVPDGGTIAGTIQEDPTGATCTSVVTIGGYTPAPTDGCTLTLGYWKNHWSTNIPSFTNGTYTWDNPTLLAILQHNDAGGDLFYKLMHQLITAWLNTSYGSGMSSTMVDTFNAAKSCITGQYTACPNATNLASQLDTYNNGNATGNPDHCPNAPQWTYTCQTTPATKGAPTCSSGLYGTYYTFKNGQFVIDYVDYKNPTFCMTAAQCPATADTNDCHSNLPCETTITGNGVVLSCGSTSTLDTSNLNASATSTCPINEVLRAPYPRAMVNTPTNFFLQPATYDDVNGYSTPAQSPANLAALTDEDGNPTEAGYAAGVWQNLVLTLRSHRFSGGETWFGQTAPEPNFVFSDRSWNTPPYPSEQTGIQATYVYRTSSQGLSTTSGRQFDMVNKLVTNIYNLPAYSVQTNTYCGHDWKASVQLSQRNWHKDGACYQTILYPDGSTYTPSGTSSEGCNPGWVANGHWVYSWSTYETNWNGVDMTQTGLQTTYDVQPHSVSGGLYNNNLYWDAPSGIWVPVLEVQSVLRGRCVADGTCPPPAAEPNSLRQ